MRVHIVACIALVTALVGGCDGHDRAAPLDAGTVAVLSVAPRSSGSTAATDPLAPGERLSLPATIRTEHTAVRLRLDDRSELSLAPGTIVSITPSSPVTVEIREGTAAVLSAEGTVGARRLTFAGTTWELPGSSWVAVRMDSEGGAMTVHQGRATQEQNVLLAGQTMRQSAGASTFQMSAPVLVPSTPYAVVMPPVASAVARVPGTDTLVSDVRVTSVQIRSSVRNGIARTEVEQVVRNGSDRALEAHVELPFPARANLSGLTLWVGERPMAGEVVERERGARWMRALVDATVPRDPALLQPSADDSMVLRVFPLPAQGERRVSHVYETLLPVHNGLATLRIPLARGALVDRFGLDVDLGPLPHAKNITTTGVDAKVMVEGAGTSVRAELSEFKPTRDVVVTFPAAGDRSWFSWNSKAGGEKTFAYRLALAEPETPLPPWHGDRVLVMDTSASQTFASLQHQIAVVRAILERTDRDERFALMACNRSCQGYPQSGLVEASWESARRALEWAESLVPQASTDLGGAIVSASGRLDAKRNGQLVVMGDGRPSAGRLWPETIASFVERSVRGTDVRLLGVGSADDAALMALAGHVGATYERVAPQTNLQEVALALRVPPIAHVQLTVPEGVDAVHPSTWPSIRPGQSVLIVGKAKAQVSGALLLRGTIGDKPYEFSATPAWGDPRASGNPAVERLWAAEAIRELEVQRDDGSRRESIALSKRHHVLSRHTAMIALDSNEQFARFGISRSVDDGTEDYFGQQGAKQGALEDRWVSTGGATHACCPPSDLICNMRAAAGSARRRRVEPTVVFAPAKLEKPSGVAGALPSRREELESRARERISLLDFVEAGRSADALIKIDPTSRVIRELLANAYAGQGRGPMAVSELDAQAEIEPGDAWAHERVARAFEVLGDRNAACAHWRAVVELDPSRDDARYAAIRCGAFEDVAAALAEARAIKRPSARLRDLIEVLEKKGEAPDYVVGAPGAIEAEVECPHDCPVPIVVTPRGEVLSPWTPSSARSGKLLVGEARPRRGKYRVLLVGGSLDQGGHLLVRALGRRHQVELADWAADKVLDIIIQ